VATRPPKLQKMNTSRSGRSIKGKALEWPPRCPTGVCDVRKGCLCTHNATAASAYFDCAAQIHGLDAPGMPTVRPADKSLPAKNDKSVVDTPPQIKRQRGIPPGAAGLAKRQRQLELELTMLHESSTATLDTDQPLASPDMLMMLFSEALDENCRRGNISSPRHTVLTVDLLCDEDPAFAMGDKKRVRWTGLPEEPPEWVTGKRRKVPRSWQPCVHVSVGDGLLCLRDQRADESRIKTLPTRGVEAVWA
jgi:hypothetical protein